MPVPPHLLAAIRQPAFAYRADGTVAGANDLAVALAERPLDGMAPADIIDLFQIRGRDRIGIFPHELPAARALAGEEVVDVPLTITAADGRVVHILATASPLEEEGATPGVLSVWQDVTALVEAEERERQEREELQAQNEELQMQQEELRVQEEELRCQADELRESEDALRVSLERLAFAQRAAQTGFWDWDMLTGRLAWSPEFYDLFGLDPAAPATFDTWLAVMHPDDHEPAMATLDRAVREGTRLENQYRIVLPGGAVRWIGAYGDTTYDAAGAPVRMAGICIDITERRRAEEELRETRDYLDSLIDHANAPIIVWDPAFRITRFNAAFERLSGYAADEVLGRDLAVLFPAKSREESFEKIRRTTTERWQSVEIPILRPDGEVRIALWNSANIHDSEGTRLLATIAQGQDITERKAAEAALRESAARRELLADVASRLLGAEEEPQMLVDEFGRRALGVLDCDVFFNYIADEDSGRLVLNAYGGIPAAEAARIQYLDYGAAVCGCVARDGCRIVAEAIPGHPDPKTALVAGYGVRAYACHPLVMGGRTIGTLSFGTRSRDAFDGDELATMQAIADLIAVAMQRIADREALRRRSEELEAVMDLVPAAIWVGHDSSCTRITGNRAANEFYEAEPGENVSAGRLPPETPSPRTFYAPEGRPLSPEDLPMQLAAARNEIITNAEFEVALPSGRRRHLLGSAVPLREADGAVRGAVAAFLDISSRREAEAELAEYANRLARSNEELQRFAYVASHDLQEPLRNIVSFSQLLERRYRGQLGEDADEYIGFIVDGGVRMQNLIRDLLQVSRLETAAKDPVPTDAGTVVRDALAVLNGQIRELGGSVTVGPLPVVMADPAQLEQVFVNLIGNAIKYRREGVPPAIAITAQRLNPTVEFAVQDNGIGIEEEYFDRIFEMFRRLHTHDQYEGTGIGLAVVKRIVERHGGRIRVESTPGEGSTFFFTLPAA